MKFVLFRGEQDAKAKNVKTLQTGKYNGKNYNKRNRAETSQDAVSNINKTVRKEIYLFSITFLIG